MSDAVQVAIRLSKVLDAMPPKQRESVLDILWFYYIGRHCEWRKGRRWLRG